MESVQAQLGQTGMQLVEILIALAIGAAVRWGVARVCAYIGRAILTRRGDLPAWKQLVRAANPLGTLAMAATLWYLFPTLDLTDRVQQIATVAVRVLAAGAGVMLAYRFVDLAAVILAERAARTTTKLDDQIVPLGRRATKVFVAAIGLIFVLQNLNVDVTSLLAGASLGGLAFSFAAKDTVANLFGSISIFADQPFQIGDYVKIDGNAGVVEHVGMRSTRIRTPDRSLLSIPNSIVANVAVDNFGLREFRRCRVTLGLTYGTTPDQIKAFVDGITAILERHQKVRNDRNEVHFHAFGDSALEFLLQFFIDTSEWHEELTVRHEVFVAIMQLAEQLDVDWAFPTQSLHIESLPTQSD